MTALRQQITQLYVWKEISYRCWPKIKNWKNSHYGMKYDRRVRIGDPSRLSIIFIYCLWGLKIFLVLFDGKLFYIMFCARAVWILKKWRYHFVTEYNEIMSCGFLVLWNIRRILCGQYKLFSCGVYGCENLLFTIFLIVHFGNFIFVRFCCRFWKVHKINFFS